MVIWGNLRLRTWLHFDDATMGFIHLFGYLNIAKMQPPDCHIFINLHKFAR